MPKVTQLVIIRTKRQPDAEPRLLTQSPASSLSLPQLSLPSSMLFPFLRCLQMLPSALWESGFPHMFMLLLSNRFLSLSPYSWTELGIKQI